ncbi:MAG: hypothetical protein LBB56_07470 [Chitinispirillales bacterium]|jgi:hypothetical protein|nr:hypothetical protein [Chitinispirillales bacterium]
MTKYEFGAGGFKLGERVEILTTKHRGILIGEMIHLSGCNTYRVLLPTVKKEYDGGFKIINIDHLLLRKLEQNESVLQKDSELTEDNSFMPKGADVNAEWLLKGLSDKKEPMPEIDEAIGVEDIAFKPGAEVWNKVYGFPMLLQYIHREIYTKELVYGLSYMADGKEVGIDSHSYGLLLMSQKIDVFPNSKPKEKVGPILSDSRLDLVSNNYANEYHRFGLEE